MNFEVINNIFAQLTDEFPNLELVSNIRSGKEADVFLVSCNKELMALKVFKRNTKFSTRNDYMNLNAMKSRERKAIIQKSNIGRSLVKNIWTRTEFEAMSELYQAGASVPASFASTQESILMEYIGDFHGPAPRLSDVKLNKEEAKEVFEQVLDSLNIFIECGIIHGDLSEYNILFWNYQV